MASDPVRELGHIEDDHGGVISIGVDYDSVAIYLNGWLSADGISLTASQAEEFGALFISAVWQAAQQEARMDGENDG